MAEQRLELVWPGKDKFLLVPKDETGKPVWVERDHPAASEVRLADLTGVVGEVPDDPYAANLLFKGDSLDVLRILCEVPEYRAIYRGKVKLVYIDPPFPGQWECWGLGCGGECGGSGSDVEAGAVAA
jgi:adenine-specific DNA-methyltransferase